jgi:hypothetical protein
MLRVSSGLSSAARTWANVMFVRSASQPGGKEGRSISGSQSQGRGGLRSFVDAVDTGRHLDPAALIGLDMVVGEGGRALAYMVKVSGRLEVRGRMRQKGANLSGSGLRERVGVGLDEL